MLYAICGMLYDVISFSSQEATPTIHSQQNLAKSRNVKIFKMCFKRRKVCQIERPIYHYSFSAIQAQTHPTSEIKPKSATQPNTSIDQYIQTHISQSRLWSHRDYSPINMAIEQPDRLHRQQNSLSELSQSA